MASEKEWFQETYMLQKKIAELRGKLSLREWISVDKELPVAGVDVLFVVHQNKFSLNDIICLGHRTTIGEDWYSDSGCVYPVSGWVVTHWMPLPDLPAQQEKEE